MSNLKFNIYVDIMTKRSFGPPTTWVEAGEYNVVRYFDDKRLLIDVSTDSKKQLTVVALNKGMLYSVESSKA